ncbi:MAG: isopentenyl phosphate kinase [Methanomassiliicoccus sp.]|nr:isopentenyl phosphate kinase [Methanomassiliicoccus sp.]
MLLVKLGGSVITDKMNYRVLREGILKRLAEEIAGSGETTVVVHGAGSFGHVVAAKHRIQNGYEDASQLMGAAQVLEDVRVLNLAVTSALVRSGVPAVSLPPSALVRLSGGVLESLDVDAFRRYLALGIAPVTFGDVALDVKRGFGICSGDQLMEVLARELSPRRIIFCSDVDGVFSSDPRCDPSARMYEVVDRSVLDALPRTQHCADVTGSIYGKIETMLRIAAHGGGSMVINGMVPGRLAAAMRGEEVVGTRVVV